MAITIYSPDFSSVNSGNTTTFDGSASSTNSAVITSLSGDFDAEISIERSNDGGSTWQQTTVLKDTSDGDSTFEAAWHSQGNRILVSTGVRRVKIENVDTDNGVTEIIGDEV